MRPDSCVALDDNFSGFAVDGGNSDEGEFIELYELPIGQIKSFIGDHKYEKPLGVLYDNPVKDTNRIHIFLALNATPTGQQKLDITEEIEVIKSDVSYFESCKSAVAEVEKKYGDIEVVINNAGITKDRFLHKMNPEEWNSVINTNLNSLFNIFKIKIFKFLNTFK